MQFYYDELSVREPVKVSTAANYAKEFIDSYLKRFPKNESTFGTFIVGWHKKTVNEINDITWMFFFVHFFKSSNCHWIKGYELYHVSVSGPTRTKEKQEVCTIGFGSIFSSQYLNMLYVLIYTLFLFLNIFVVYLFYFFL